MTSKDDTNWILFEKYLPSRYIMEGYPNLRFKLQNGVSMHRLWQQCPSQTGGFTMWPVFTVAAQIMHHLQTFFSNCITVVLYLTPQIINRKSRNVVYWKHCQFPQLLTHSIIGNATTKYEEFLWGKAINQSVLMKWKYNENINKNQYTKTTICGIDLHWNYQKHISIHFWVIY